ncbi:MAG TPA: prolyl oligopeptidase family serine peptidase [Jatrophihabitantaceae bacterium]|nr:prolyl oligopeptidase family serine peptidase [Jatrophihabitantaceae bacterium]
MPTVAPYGSWRSPISAADLVTSGHPVEGGAYVGEHIWWSELRPSEGGRYAVRRMDGAGEPVDVLPVPWNARTRVHEYGGGAWTATADGALIFAEFSDQRLYRLDPGSEQPVPITPEPPTAGAWRYAELQLRGDEVLCVREHHDADGVHRDIAAVPVSGAAAEDDSAIRSLVARGHFLAYPRISPDGRRLAWIAWEHPNMPWDGTELRVAELGADGTAGPYRVLAGDKDESVLQPEWDGPDHLYAISDRTGYWNLYRVDVEREELDSLCPMEADFGGPLWQLGGAWYRVLEDGRLLTVRTLGTDTVAILDPTTGELTDLDLGIGALGRSGLGPVRGDRALVVVGSASAATGLRELELRTGALTDVRLSVDAVPDAGYLPAAELMTFPGPSEQVHAVVYPPRNADFAAPEGELPPYVAFVHGGPTAHVGPALSVVTAFFTSRGIGVVDVNYGGSTGYGRAYRERLKGQWGVVDVEDTAAAVRGLAEAGLADPDRLAIEGGSAGGWTVLAALTTTKVFACGVSYFGVAELVQFVAETHDFESRYLDGLIGPLPEARELYERRAPVNNVDGLSCPVLLLQGLDDPIVPPSQAERFRDALVAKGLPHAYRAYEGESHGFRKAETIIDSREAELSFYGQVFGFEPADVPVLELWRP